MVDWKEVILFIIAIFGCLFGIYQFLRKNTTDNASNDTMVMTELKHISSDMAEVKGELRAFRVDAQALTERVIRNENKVERVESDLDTAFTRIDELRTKLDNRISAISQLEGKFANIETRIKYIEDLKKT